MISLRNIIKVYDILKKRAQKEFASGEYHKSYATIKRAASLATQFNWRYADEELESLLNSLSKIYLPIERETLDVYEDKFVLIDDFCRSFILAIQYLDAFKAMGNEVLYVVTSSEMAYGSSKSILDRVKQYPNVNVLVVDDNLSEQEKSQFLYDAIIDFAPSKVFLHVHEQSPSLLALYRLPKSIKRYMINLSDQRFWLGARAIDYSIEFRPFGATVSLEKRGLKKEQLLYVPFYPVVDGNAFKGFPKISSDKIILFSGGDFYKTVSPKQEYWEMVRRILNDNSNTVLFYAIKSRSKKDDDFLARFTKQNNLQDRLFNIGFRDDINEVFAHCDIFLGTCPTSGSLMTQLAAWNKKPILQLYLPNTSDDETEQAICYHERFSISFDGIEELLAEAKLMVKDASYRKIQGERLFNTMIKPEEFTNVLTKSLKECKQLIPFKKINYQEITNRWFWLEEVGYIDTRSYVISLIGTDVCKRIMPIVWLKYISKKIINYVKMRFVKMHFKNLLDRIHRAISNKYAYWEKSKIFYRTWTGKELNLQNPNNISEKLMWLSRYWQHPLKTLCADKYYVRQYISKCGYANLLVPLIGVWDNADSIDFNLLPKKFVLKCNHGCGFNIICEDKEKLDYKQTINRINNWLNIKFGLDTFEVHYSKIQPRVICEEFLQPVSGNIVDYKLHCINGEPHSFLVCRNRSRTNHNEVQILSYSLKWNKLNVIINEESIDIECPKHLHTMINVARVLSKPFPYVRVDFYEVNDNLYVGELTFTPQCNIMDYYKEEFLQEMGEQLQLPKRYNN